MESMKKLISTSKRRKYTESHQKMENKRTQELIKSALYKIVLHEILIFTLSF